MFDVEKGDSKLRERLESGGNSALKLEEAIAIA